MITIRNASAHDRQELVRITRQQKNFNAQEIDVAIEVIDDGLDPDKKDYTILVSDGQGGLAGYIIFGPIPFTDNRYDLYWVATDLTCGRKGIGSRLLQVMEEKIHSTGKAHIYVDTSSTEGYIPARSFYEKHGYAKACVLADFYRDGDDKVIYLKEI
jgi:ribosomal protein S18 acetylase RimI-like enzyme